jgi:choline dehydrogenase
VHPLCAVFLEAAAQAGFPRTPDYNGAEEEGVAAYQITTQRGMRASSATAFLRPAMRRPNLAVLTGALVDRVLFDGRRAVGVSLLRGGVRQEVRAAQVILSAGAVASPALLQRSGVGPAAVLSAAGIAPRHVLPAGEHLQDHLGIDYLYEANVPTMNGALRSWAGRAALALRYVTTLSGPFALSVNQAGGFVRSAPGLAHADTQLYFSPASYSRPTPGVRRLTLPDPFPGMMLGLSQCRPKSRGSVRIASADPAAAPVIEPNYLSDPADMEEILRGCLVLRAIAATAAFRRIVVREVAPGPEVAGRAALEADIRARAGSVFHASCTCRMGPDPSAAVVDARLRVHGLENLRVIDASVFPSVTSGNTNAPTLMVAEKGAAMALEDFRA